MDSFLLANIEVGSHLYVNFSEDLHLHAETLIVSTLVVLVLTSFLFLAQTI